MLHTESIDTNRLPMLQQKMQQMCQCAFRRVVIWLLLASAGAMLSACGFQLQGSHDYPFKRLYIVGAPSPAMYARLKRLIEAGGDTKVLDTAVGADAILSMSSGRGQSALSFNTAGVVQEYMLTTSLVYTLATPNGNVLIPTSTINLNRSMTYSTTYALAKQSEADVLYDDMNQDIADQLVRRLDVVKTLNGPSQVPPVMLRAPLPTPPL